MKDRMEFSEDRVIELLIRQTRKVIYFCDAGNISTSMSVHEIRKSLKRIRAWMQFFEHLPILDSIIDKKESLKEIAARLSDIRESFVNIALSDKYFTGKQYLPEKKVRMMNEILTKENQKQVETLFNGENYFKLVRQEISGFEKQVQALTGIVSEEIVFNQLVENYFELNTLYEGIDWKNCSAGYLHSIRKKLKQLWYQYEVVKSHSARYFGSKIRQLNEITEILGNDHDNSVFSECIRQHCFVHLTNDDKHIFNNLIGHQQELAMLQLQVRLKQFFAESPEVFQKRLVRLLKKKDQVKTVN